MFKLFAVFVALVMAMCAAGGVLVGVADAAAPGDALYGLDRGVESLRLKLAISPASAQDLHELFAQERLDEVQTLAARGDEEHLEQALQELGKALLQASGAEASLEAAPAAAPEDEGPDDDLGAYCDGTATKNHPVGEKLATRFDVDYKVIMDWACSGYGFGSIKQAYQISQATDEPVSVSEIFAKFDSGLGWGEVAQFYGLKDKSGDGVDDGDDGDDDNGDGDDDDGDDGDDDGDDDDDGFKQPKQGTHCDGTAKKKHPTGMKLADRYGVDYKTIMDCFCDGYGFGEIDLAYSIALAADVPVGEIFAKRGSGTGWGNIMKEYEIKGKPLKDTANKGKSQDKGNKGKSQEKGNKGKKPKNP